jgi:hypothetical protein
MKIGKRVHLTDYSYPELVNMARKKAMAGRNPLKKAAGLAFVVVAPGKRELIHYLDDTEAPTVRDAKEWKKMKN